ncbi:MAG: archaeal proteasome endopeptidase complex subunit alpha [Candidatus Undinarchaeales archaeon]|jgi:proteasome alpha subunit|nr:archaeal proteasome endopeptidase complex subunit alpha [Candidatus Undinarchaeales archaeon]
MEMQPPQMMGYDRAITVFSPQGRLYQVEYAREAVKKGTVSLGIVYKDGVLLAADKNVNEELMVADSVEKLFKIDEHVGAATSGLVADGRRIIDKARVIAQSHKITYDEPIAVDSITKEICDYKQLHTQVAGVRPFGTALLLAGVDGSPKLFETDPSGSFWEYKATAIGENVEKVKELLQKGYKEEMGLEQAIELGLKALYKGTNERFNERSIEIVYIDINGKFHAPKPEKIKEYILKVIGNVKKGKK